ncbi:hypothetical protein [Curtobacterium sp. ISL-83]|uniref:hypothetical protein n=1 Tax=Curtobacterium sp. ISL-83 TaxID=2819145 RepID=UPI001BEB3015|nr:hypothetical protein [Curtobacterium sp. ISL-83]MBT2501391.1 hypothetical protein [Curtobacterium sp. ISL-83]
MRSGFRITAATAMAAAVAAGCLVPSVAGAATGEPAPFGFVTTVDGETDKALDPDTGQRQHLAHDDTPVIAVKANRAAHLEVVEDGHVVCATDVTAGGISDCGGSQSFRPGLHMLQVVSRTDGGATTDGQAFQVITPVALPTDVRAASQVGNTTVTGRAPTGDGYTVQAGANGRDVSGAVAADGSFSLEVPDAPVGSTVRVRVGKPFEWSDTVRVTVTDGSDAGAAPVVALPFPGIVDAGFTIGDRGDGGATPEPGDDTAVAPPAGVDPGFGIGVGVAAPTDTRVAFENGNTVVSGSTNGHHLLQLHWANGFNMLSQTQDDGSFRVERPGLWSEAVSIKLGHAGADWKNLPSYDLGAPSNDVATPTDGIVDAGFGIGDRGDGGASDDTAVAPPGWVDPGFAIGDGGDGGEPDDTAVAPPAEVDPGFTVGAGEDAAAAPKNLRLENPRLRIATVLGEVEPNRSVRVDWNGDWTENIRSDRTGKIENTRAGIYTRGVTIQVADASGSFDGAKVYDVPFAEDVEVPLAPAPTDLAVVFTEYGSTVVTGRTDGEREIRVTFADGGWNQKPSERSGEFGIALHGEHPGPVQVQIANAFGSFDGAVTYTIPGI